jgi:hypothetical protein
MRYSTESIRRGTPTTGLWSTVVRTTISPPGTTREGAISSHLSGEKVARDAAMPNLAPPYSSTRARITFAFPQAHSLTAVFKNATRLARGSSKDTPQSGLRTENGIAGKPPPDPTSTKSDSWGTSRHNAKQSTRCSESKSLTLLAPVRLTRWFHSRRRRI